MPAKPSLLVKAVQETLPLEPFDETLAPVMIEIFWAFVSWATKLFDFSYAAWYSPRSTLPEERRDAEEELVAFAELSSVKDATSVLKALIVEGLLRTKAISLERHERRGKLQK